MWTALASPTRIGLLLVGNISAQCLYAASLLACLAAFGASVNFWTLVALNIGITLIASLVPFPGGGTAVSAVGLSGFLTALGVPAAGRGGRGDRPPARGELPPGHPGVVRHQRPGEEADALTALATQVPATARRSIRCRRTSVRAPRPRTSITPRAMSTRSAMSRTVHGLGAVMTMRIEAGEREDDHAQRGLVAADEVGDR